MKVVTMEQTKPSDHQVTDSRPRIHLTVKLAPRKVHSHFVSFTLSSLITLINGASTEIHNTNRTHPSLPVATDGGSMLKGFQRLDQAAGSSATEMWMMSRMDTSAANHFKTQGSGDW